MSDEIFSPKLKMYLENKKVITRWAKVGEEEHQELHRFLVSMSSELAIVANELDAEVTGAPSVDDRWVVVGLYRERWKLGGERPRICVGISWSPEKVAFQAFGTNSDQKPYVGVHVEDVSSNRPLRDKLRNQLCGDGWLDQDGWPRWVYVPGGDDYRDYWNDVDAFRALLTAKCRDAWTLFADGVDSILQEIQAAQ